MKVLLNCRMTFTVDPAALLEAWLPTGTVSMWHSTPKLLKDFLVALINDSCEGSLSDLNVTELWPRSRTNHTNSVHRYFNGLPAFCSVGTACTIFVNWSCMNKQVNLFCSPSSLLRCPWSKDTMRDPAFACAAGWILTRTICNAILAPRLLRLVR